MRVGLLGGSFNPAHTGHLHISKEALKRLGLDQVWWLVTPGNPLKSPADRKNFPARFNSAQQVAEGNPHIKVLDIENKFGTFRTYDTLLRLKAKFPDYSMVWLMGADNLESFHKWYRWQDIFRIVPITVFDRGEDSLTPSKAATFFKSQRVAEGMNILGNRLPCWCFIRIKKQHVSSTAIRKSS